ncbi:MAG: Gfo/Idh/MocA family protein [Candidatus Azotimanducaceae bacterium]|uniref:Gfo/Idh/MocA family oxidoreductase n=1 Tax=OM182 bacterium TaxID=2510334 RepID=A0A520RX68_9GAMM|nr:hypothetical protein [Gammaproteobacteria bacterium]OUV67017.1 MAG: hypothetical protein CBC93_06860 [Gammaproteobacteria bacterium TMED133]RZO74795.1 MAG: Gfo/Idh/MocA family oxidoreductase [OM182 bacterium]
MKAKIGLLGCGNPSRNWYMPTLKELTKRGEIEWVALCDMDEKLAKEYGEHYSVPYYTSLDEMLDKNKDLTAVCIVTSDPLHHVLGSQVAERGVHVMVEKPMAMTLPACDMIIDACRRNNVHFEVAENYFRWSKQRLILKLIKEGVLGDIVRVYFSEPKRQLPFEPKVSYSDLGRPISGFGRTGGMVMDMGAHRLSQLRLYAQSNAKQITATVRRYRSDPTILAEDWAHAMIEFESGAMGIYETSRVGELQKYCQITGTRGGILDHDYMASDIPLRLLDGEEWKDIHVETERRNIGGVDVLQRIIVHTNPQIVYENPFRNYMINDWCVGHAAEIMSIANAAINDEPAEYGLGGRQDVEMAMAIYESSLKGTIPIKLPLEGITDYEKALHEDYLEKFGQPIIPT